MSGMGNAMIDEGAFPMPGLRGCCWHRAEAVCGFLSCRQSGKRGADGEAEQPQRGSFFRGSLRLPSWQRLELSSSGGGRETGHLEAAVTAGEALVIEKNDCQQSCTEQW